MSNQEQNTSARGGAVVTVRYRQLGYDVEVQGHAGDGETALQVADRLTRALSKRRTAEPHGEPRGPWSEAFNPDTGDKVSPTMRPTGKVGSQEDPGGKAVVLAGVYFTRRTGQGDYWYSANRGHDSKGDPIYLHLSNVALLGL